MRSLPNEFAEIWNNDIGREVITDQLIKTGKNREPDQLKISVKTNGLNKNYVLVRVGKSTIGK
ncbi:MAG: hypothetical protein KKD44_10675 [Proteobacteria bacterium]|nr:hypothetical protein [Pseudomonadota bacterium]